MMHEPVFINREVEITSMQGREISIFWRLEVRCQDCSYREFRNARRPSEKLAAHEELEKLAIEHSQRPIRLKGDPTYLHN